LKFTSKLYSGRKKDSSNHVKSIGTDEAWQVYENLVDTYFRQREALQAVKQAVAPPSSPISSVEWDLPLMQMHIEMDDFITCDSGYKMRVMQETIRRLTFKIKTELEEQLRQAERMQQAHRQYIERLKTEIGCYRLYTGLHQRRAV
jgi:hypothetical protein